MKQRIFLVAIVAGVLPFDIFAKSNELDTLKRNTERWIETRQRLSEEQAAWEVEKQVLANGIDTLKATRNTLTGDALANADESRKIDEALLDAKARLGRLEDASELLLSQIIKYESRILSILPSLPPPLSEELAPFMAKLPSPGATSDLAPPHRLQNVVAITTLIDEFNNDLRLNHAIRELNEGGASEVRILYWGLAAGFAIDGTGTRAWSLAPSESGWIWQASEQEIHNVKKLFEVYDKIEDPVLIGVPIAIDERSDAP